MLTSLSTNSFKLLTQTAKTQAIAGAAAGVTLGAIRGIILVRRNGLRDGYDVAAEGLSQIGTGAVLGIMGGLAASVTGVSVAAVAGRGILAIAAPVVASTMVTSSMHERIARTIRPWSESVLNSLKHTLQGPAPIPQLTRA